MSSPRVAVLAFEDISPFHLAVPSLVLGPESPPSEAEPWRITVCTPSPGLLRTSGGFDVAVADGLEATADADIVIVPWWGDPDTAAPTEVTDAIRRAYGRGAVIVGLCLGTFVVADSGVLDGRTATTHWKWADAFRRRFPLVTVDPAALYVDEGAVLTGAGASAGVDTCLHLLANHEGQHVANRVARRIVAAPHRAGGQAQFIEAPAVGDVSDPVGAACQWALEHLAEPLTIDMLADVAHLSRSALTRGFRARTGTTVTKWVAQQRIARARELLESTNRSVEWIADQCGFGGGAILREHFRAALGTSPRAYRETFRATG